MVVPQWQLQRLVSFLARATEGKQIVGLGVQGLVEEGEPVGVVGVVVVETAADPRVHLVHYNHVEAAFPEDNLDTETLVVETYVGEEDETHQAHQKEGEGEEDTDNCHILAGEVDTDASEGKRETAVIVVEEQ